MNSNLKKEFFFQGNEVGCLLIHGFTSTPAELYELGVKISRIGYTVLGVRLEGHGTTIEDMERCSYRHWIKSVEDGYRRLKERCAKIYVIGHSMGGLLSLYVGENFEVEKIIALAPAVINKDKRSPFVGILKYFMKYTEWKDVERPEEEKKYLLRYNRFPVASVHELNKLQKVVKRDLNKIKKPLLIIQSPNDTSVHAKGIDILEKAVSSKEVKKILLDKCNHNITVECEKEKVFSEVLNFIG